MARSITINRDEAELLVDVLEDNYRRGKYQPSGVGADLASEIRQLFGMTEQPSMEYKELAYYNYKRVVYRDDYVHAKKELEERDGEEYEDSVDYDGEAWVVVEFLLDKLQSEIADLEKFREQAFEAHSNIDRDIELLGG